jgi:2,3-bisphosphoglycerate-independent phosphoglycerate mutase
MMAMVSLPEHFRDHRPVLLIVMDGWGLGTGGAEDAVAQADTPNFDRLWRDYPHTRLLTHGPYVGLASTNDLGGSEVGHFTMGAGKILDQGPTRISKAIADGSFFHSEALRTVTENCLHHGSTLHLLGLLSDGNVHSHIDHIMALIEYADRQGIARLRMHALLDGRDVGIQTAQVYVAQLQQLFDRINSEQGGRDYRFASGGGREAITMDRDHNWNKVQEGWELHVHGRGEHRFTSMQEAIDHFRAVTPGLVDQDMPGFVIVDADGKAVGPIRDGDGVINVNFRGDRAIEITEAFCLDDFDGFDRGRRPQVCYAGMMVYDEDRNLPELQLMGPTKLENPFGKRILELGIRQFRLTETQKFPHVTFFFNGGYREPLDADMEDYILIPSDKGVSFADHPLMQADRIADKAVELIADGRYGFGLINLANADMVGHCGRMEPAIRAVEAVDAAVGRIIEALQAAGGSAIITADHGNVEVMQVKTKQGEEPSTKHSLNPVPCILFDSAAERPYALRQLGGSMDPQRVPGLSNIAATLFVMLGMQPPEDINPSLFETTAS